MIDNLCVLTLADGLPSERDGKPLRWRTVHLRETTVADERAAQRLAERVAMVAGVPKLLVSEAEFRYALTMLHIDAFECDGQRIGRALIDIDLMGKLSSHDLGLIEQRVFLITLAAEVRYGNISQDDFDAVMAGRAPASAGVASTAAAPQPVGQAASVGPVGLDAEPGPALLADYAGDAAPGAPAVDGR